MPTFNDTLRRSQEAVQAGSAVIWTPAHADWMAKPHYERVYSDAAIEHALRTLRGEDVPERTGDQRHRFSASSVGGRHGEDFSCHRETLFKYIGAPRIAPTATEQDNMDAGSALHLHYQMEGISAGYIVSCENWIYDPVLRYGMKEDGLLYDSSLLELKFVHGKKFTDIMRGDRQRGIASGPKMGHLIQVTGGMHIRGLQWCSLVYVNKENGEAMEYRIPLSDVYLNLLLEVLDDLRGWVDLDELPEVLDGCVAGTSWQAKHCAFRDHCPTARTVSIG